MLKFGAIALLILALAGVSIRLAQERMGLNGENQTCFCDGCAPVNYPADMSRPHYGTEWVDEGVRP